MDVSPTFLSLSLFRSCRRIHDYYYIQPHNHTCFYVYTHVYKYMYIFISMKNLILSVRVCVCTSLLNTALFLVLLRRYSIVELFDMFLFFSLSLPHFSVNVCLISSRVDVYTIEENTPMEIPLSLRSLFVACCS